MFTSPAKALIAWNLATNELRSGQIPAGAGVEHWIDYAEDAGVPGLMRDQIQQTLRLKDFALH